MSVSQILSESARNIPQAMVNKMTDDGNEYLEVTKDFETFEGTQEGS